MKRWVLLLGALGVVGCAHELVWEPTAQVTLSGGLEVHWRSLDAEGAAGEPLPLVLTFRSVAAGPVVLCRVLRVDGAAESPASIFVHAPAPGRFRYDGASDSIVALSGGGAPFSLAPAFAWYDQVLYPRAEGVSVNVGQARPRRRRTAEPSEPLGEGTQGASPAFESAAAARGEEPAVRVVVEYMPLTYRRLSTAGFAQSVGAPAKEKEDTGIRFRRLSEKLLRQKQPPALFLQREYLPLPTRVPLEIPWGTRRP